MSTTDEARLRAFIERYSPTVAAPGSAILDELRARLPHADLLVYDNYNALAVGFAPDEKASHVVVSLAFYPRWTSLFVFGGSEWDDPDGLLEGSGSTTRHVKVRSLDDFRRPEVDSLIAQALQKSSVPFDSDRLGRVIVKSVSARQRPRRPA